MNTVILSVILIAVCELVLSAVQFILRKREKKTSALIILTVVKILVAVAFGALVLAGPVILRPLQPVMMAAYIVLFAEAVADIVCSAGFAIFKKSRSFPAAKITGIIFCALFACYAILNMNTVNPHYHTYESDKIDSEHTFAFVADLHSGDTQPFSVTEQTVMKIMQCNPDFTVLGGDITDDYTTKDEMEKTFALFGGFKTPVYYIYGNHDRQEHARYANGRQYTIEEFEKAMTDNGIIILKDEFVRISPDLMLLGREDVSNKEGRAPADSLKNPDRGAFLITADHQPTEFDENLKAGTDLQVSGHTHAGQLFPLKFLYTLIGGKVYGDYESGGSMMLVSSGASGWRLPLRTDAHSNFEIITLKPLGE